MSFDPVALKRRRNLMLAVNGLAVVVAALGIAAYFHFAQAWGLPVFVAALLAGFGAQIWFIAGLRRTSKGA